MSNIVLPQVLVYQQFKSLPDELVEPLRAFLFGPEFNLHRYTVSSEKVKAGTYNYLLGNTFNWQTDLGRAAGAVVDQTYSKVYIENGLLKYWSDEANPQTSSTSFSAGPGGIIATPEGTKNRVRFRNLTDALVASTGYNLDSSFHGRDVQIGDYLIARLNWNGTNYTAGGTIIGFEADQIASSVGTVALASANKATQIAAAAASAKDAATVSFELILSGTYNGIPDGVLNETYTVSVVRGSTGSNPSTMLLNITSASGKDDSLGYAPVTTTYASTIPLASNGLYFRFNATAPTEVPTGATWTVTVGQAYTRPTAASGGTYSGTTDTTYVVTVVEGGDFSSGTEADQPLVQVTTSTGVDSEAPKRVSASPMTVGKYGVTISWTGATKLVAGDQWYIPAVAAADGPIRTVILDKSLPTVMLTTDDDAQVDLSVDLCIKKNFELPAQLFELSLTNWSQSSTAITLGTDAKDYDSTWRDGEYALPLIEGDVYIHWRELITDHSNRIYEVSTISDIEDIFTTANDPDNPLVYAAYKALQNSGDGTANVTGIRVCAVGSNDLEGYTEVLAKAEGRDDLYSLVPLTFDRTIQNLVSTHVSTMSTPEKGRWRIAFFCSEEQNPAPILQTDSDATTILATTDSSGYVDLDNSSDVQFITDGVKAGDILRIGYGTDVYGNTTYGSYVIDQVISESRLKLVTWPSPVVGTASKCEIWRNLKAADVADQIGNKASSFASRRIYNVFPSSLPSGGVDVAGYFLCAALAGIVGSVVPQQGLTNVEILGFDNVNDVVDRFSRSNLDAMANKGVWIVTQDLGTNQLHTRMQLSTLVTDLNTRELSLVKNIDSVSYYFLGKLKPYIGRANVTPTSIEVIRTQLEGGISYLRSAGFNPLIGGQVLEGTKVTKLQQHSVLKDRIECIIEVVPPYPLNNIELTLVV